MDNLMWQFALWRVEMFLRAENALNANGCVCPVGYQYRLYGAQNVFLALTGSLYGIISASPIHFHEDSPVWISTFTQVAHHKADDPVLRKYMTDP
jgi:hypothetical protein